MSLEDTPRPSERRSTKFVRQLDRLASAADSRPWLLILALFFLYGEVIHRNFKPLWYDELFTFYIAQAHSFHQMILWTRSVDLNPPLYYIFARAIFHVFKPGPVSLRLPSLIFYFVAAMAAYQFVGRRLPRLYGCLAAIVIFGSGYSYYANEARPYALILGFLGIAAVSWQIAIEEGKPRRWAALLLFTLAAFGMLLSHVLALIAYGAFFAAELARLIIRRKPDWPLWICLAIPLISYVTYRPLVQSHGGGIYPPAFQASIQGLFENYSNLWGDVAPFLAASVVLIVFLGRKQITPDEPTARTNFTVPELVFALALILVPLEILLLFMRSHSQYFPRYGIAAVFGVAILVPSFLKRWTGGSRRAALIASIIFCFGIFTPTSIARHLQSAFQPALEENSRLTGVLNIPISHVDPSLPLVAASGLTFVEMSSRESPEFLSRVYFLVDHEGAFQYAHANGFNSLLSIKKVFPIHGTVEQYQKFVTEHPKFLVLGTYSFPDDWLLRKLVADGANVNYLGMYSTSYKDHDLYEVTLAPSATTTKP